MVTVRAARRSRWRLVGGHLIATDGSLRFEPNRLERRLTDAHWACRAGDVTALRRQGRVWLVVETGTGTEVFRIFGAGAAEARLDEALHPAPTAQPVG
jgi:hypothetical protein